MLYIPLSYRSQSPVPRVPGAEGITVSVTTNDRREITEGICGKIPQGFRRTVVLDTTTDLTGLVSRSIKAELSHRGFEIGSKGVQVVANLWIFYCQPGGQGETVDADVSIDVFVYRAGHPPIGQELYYRYVHGEHIRRKLVLSWSMGYAREILESSFADAMKQLFADRRFLNTLMSKEAQSTPNAPVRAN